MKLLSRSADLYRDFRFQLGEAIVKSLPTQGAPPVVWEAPPSPARGDYASTIAFTLAKQLRSSPRKIADGMQERLEMPKGFREIRVDGAGYLNFFLDRGTFVNRFFEEMQLPSRPSPLESPRGKIIVEHTNINPNKAAHIGHVRNAVLGDTLVRCLRARGHEVEVQNYIDDTGVQVADVVVGFLDMERVSIDEIRDLLVHPRKNQKRYACFGDLCWDVYADVGRMYETRPETKGLRAETLHAIEEGNNLRAQASELVSEAIVREHVATMGRLEVEYDLLPRESDILKKGFWPRASDLLREKGAIALETEGKHAGCWVMRLGHSDEFAGMDEPDKILVRSNGTVTYTGKDIGYHLWKFGKLGIDFDYERWDADWNAGRGGADAVPEKIREHEIWASRTGSGEKPPRMFGSGSEVFNVIDVRQSYPQKVVREGLRALGLEREAEHLIHFAYEMVALTPRAAKRLAEFTGDELSLSAEDESKPWVEMSGRKGHGVKAHDLLELMVEEARTEIASRDSAIDAVRAERRGREIAVGAMRYFMLKFGRNSILAFDFDEAMAFEGETGPYLQYSLVRADNILRKLREAGLASELQDSDFAQLASADWDDDLWSIFLTCAKTGDVVDRAVKSLELSTIARHAFELAQAFSHFYHRHPILNEADGLKRLQRLAVLIAFRNTMAELFALLGIPAPEKM